MTLHPLDSLEFHRVLSLISLEAKSDIGQAILSRRRPFDAIEDCERAQSLLAEMRAFYLRDGLLPLSGLADLSPLLRGEVALDLPDSWNVLRAVRATQAVRETFLRSTYPYPRLTSIAEAIDDLGDVISAVGKFFTRDGKIREDASAELRSIRTKVQSRRSAIQKTLSDLMNREASAIQEPLITIRGDRYCVPVRTDSRSSIPGILHERSGSGSTLFVEPMPVIELNNDLAELLMREREELARIARFIAQTLLNSSDAILASTRNAGELDAIQACAVVGETLEAVRPHFTLGRELVLVEARHPLLDERLASMRSTAFGETEEPRKVVPVSFTINEEKPALVISGPNAGGKTVTLKTAGLVIAMAMSGLPVPAGEGTLIPVVDALHVLIGDDQNVLEHLSTFSSYLVRLKEVLATVSSRSLVLLDELGSGTDPEEGAALAAATIEHLFAAGCLLVATTHLSSVKSFAVGDARVENASMEFDSASGRPSFRMIQGVPGRSRAIEVAEIIGLPAAVIASAREKLGNQYLETDSLIADLQAKNASLSKQQETIDALQLELESQKTSLEAETIRISSERQKLATANRGQIDQLKDAVSRNLQNELRRLKEIDKKERGQIRPDKLFETITKPLEAMAADERSGPVAVGEKVEHRSLKLKGDLVAINGRKGTLKVGGRTIEVDVKDLIPLAVTKTLPDKKAAAARPASPASDDREAEISAELNLVGHRVEEALEESDKFLDKSLLQGKSAVRLIHGFGTGALRKAIREHLRKHPGVKSYRAGDEREGGDGATVAILDV